MRRYALMFLVMLCMVCSVADAGNYTRPTATGTITTISTQPYQDLIDSFGGNTTPENETAARVNMTSFLSGVLSVYSDPIGSLALVIIFAIPWLLMWLMQSDVVPAAVAGLIIGGFVLEFLPAEYSLLGTVFVVLALVAIVYSLLKERM